MVKKVSVSIPEQVVNKVMDEYPDDSLSGLVTEGLVLLLNEAGYTVDHQPEQWYFHTRNPVPQGARAE